MQLSNRLTQQQIIELQNALLFWFEKNQRHFLWRETKNAYHILVAEKLLQQTSVGERVVNAYHQIINEYPDIKTLAGANIDDLEALIKPLGLRYRAKELIKLASVVDKEFFGQIPQNLKVLIKLPGIGDYAARAILSFSSNEDVAIVDTNVARFLFRVYGIEEPFPANPARKRNLLELADGLLPKGQSRIFNYAILDLCALICLQRNPKCIACPINNYCKYGQRGNLKSC